MHIKHCKINPLPVLLIAPDCLHICYTEVFLTSISVSTRLLWFSSSAPFFLALILCFLSKSSTCYVPPCCQWSPLFRDSWVGPGFSCSCQWAIRNNNVILMCELLLQVVLLFVQHAQPLCTAVFIFAQSLAAPTPPLSPRLVHASQHRTWAAFSRCLRPLHRCVLSLFDCVLTSLLHKIFINY